MDKRLLSTEQLIQELKKSQNFDEFMHSHENNIKDIDVQTYLYDLLKKSDMTIPQIIDKASISRSLAYQIFNGQRTPNRNIILRMALVMKLDLEETQRLLKIAKRGELYPRVQRDAAIIYCIENNHSIIDANELLENIGEAILLKEE